MSRSEKIMKKYGNAFGRVKALLLTLCCVVLGFSIVMLVLLLQGKASADDTASMLPVMLLLLLISAAVAAVLFLPTLKKAKQKGSVSPVGLFGGMLFVGAAANLIICRPFTRLLWKLLCFCTFGIISGPSSGSKGKFAERYIRVDDNEMFYLYNDLGSYALLASESANATTIEVWPRGGKNGYVYDSSDRNYRPW